MLAYFAINKVATSWEITGLLEDEVNDFIERGANPQTLNSLLNRCMDQGTTQAMNLVRRLFEDDYGGITYKWELKEPAAAALLFWREQGIEEIAQAAVNLSNLANRTIAFDLLSSAASASPSMRMKVGSGAELWQRVIDAGGTSCDVQEAARKKLVELVLSIEREDDLAASLAQVFFRHQVSPDSVEAEKEIVRAVASRWFSIGEKTLREFQDLIDDCGSCEPVFQTFFEANPQLLDPMAIEVWPEPNLFGSRKPDFVVKRSDGSYLVVEIECPSKNLITKAGHPSADVTHAEHQVTDYRKYMLDHIGNVRNVFPGFSSPDCLVIVGLEKTLTPDQTLVLASLNEARHRIKVVGFDWLLERAKRVSKNVSEHGVIVSVKRMT